MTKKINSTTPPVLIPEVECFWDNHDLLVTWQEYVLHRKKIRKPMTPHCEELNKADCEKYAGLDSAAAVEIINRSIKNGWAGLFPLPAKPVVP